MAMLYCSISHLDIETKMFVTKGAIALLFETSANIRDQYVVLPKKHMQHDNYTI